MIRAMKNRFGPVNELGFFAIELGMQDVRARKTTTIVIANCSLAGPRTPLERPSMVEGKS